MFKLGVMVDSFRLPFKEGVFLAQKLGAEGIQCNAAQGETAPERLSAADRLDLRRLVKGAGLEISALCGDLGGHGFQSPAENAEKVPRSKAIVDLAVDLGVDVVTTHLGVIPEDSAGSVYSIMAETCREIGRYAEERGVVFAIETGPEPAERLRAFLDSLGSRGLGVNYDPANLVMVQDADPAAGVAVLAPYIVHTHAKDGVHLADCDPERVYEAFAAGGVEAFEFGRYFNETPLGEGSVDWDAYLAALRAAGREGYLTIEREVGVDPVGDIGAALRFLRSKIG
jgi:sugar phosphate isomerase/epimerase